MKEYLAGFILISIVGAVGFVVGYSRGEEHGIVMALKARCERDAKAWDDRALELGVNTAKEDE